MIDNKKIGLTIKTLRANLGITQQQLAKKLNVTDKAVSKWERGIGIPDISIINQLAIILNIDTDNLLAGNVAYLENEWIGVLDFNKFESEISINSTIYGKPSVYILLCYFALVGIKNIYIYCTKNIEESIKNLITENINTGINLYFNINCETLCKKRMVIEGPIFLYGPNLTKYFQRAMSYSGEKVYLAAITEVKESESFLIKSKNQLSNIKTSDQRYYKIPIFFENCNDYNKPDKIEIMGRGMIVIQYNNEEDILNISNLIHIIQKYNAEEIYDLEDIIIKRGLLKN